MLDRASSVVWRRSTSLRRDCTWLERVPAEKRDEVVELGDLLFALGVVRFDPRADLRFGDHHVVVAARVGDDRLVVDVRDVRADRVEEMPIVGNHDQRALVTHQELAEPVDRVEVEVVGRFVEQERLRMSEERLRQQHADFLPTLQLAHLPLVHLVGNIEALQQDRGVAFRRVAVFLADDPLELTKTHAVVVRHFRLRVERLAFGQRGPQAVVAHDHRVDDAEFVERVLILAQHAELVRPDHGALLRRELAGQQFHEGRFAGAVGAAQAVSPAGRKSHGDVVEEHLRAVPHGNTVD